MSLMDFITDIPAIKKAGYISHRQFHSGTINQNFLISTEQGKMVLRINNPCVAGINRHHEDIILKAIKGLSFAPVVIENNPDSGYLLSVYQDLPNWKAENALTHQHLLVSRLQKLHSLNVPVEIPDFNTRLLHYFLDCRENLTDRFISEYHQTINQLQNTDFFETQKLIHFDLNIHNLLGLDTLKIIDWEFAGCGHPIFDVAIFMYYQNLSPEQSRQLLQYCERFKDGQIILPLALRLAYQMNFMWELTEKKANINESKPIHIAGKS